MHPCLRSSLFGSKDARCCRVTNCAPSGAAGIPIVLMKFSLPQPEADMSLVSPIVVSVFTPVPLIALIVFLEIRKR